MDNRIDAIYGRQSIDKKDSISIESQFEFCRYELKGGEGKEYKDKGYSGKNIDRPDFQRLMTETPAFRHIRTYDRPPPNGKDYNETLLHQRAREPPSRPRNRAAETIL